MECIQRNPVRPHGENASAVDPEAERAVPFCVGRAGAFQLDRADAGAQRALVDHFAAARKRRRHVVQIRRAARPRPPESAVLNMDNIPAGGEPDPAGMCEPAFTADAFHRQGIGRQTVCVGFQAEPDAERCRLMRQIDAAGKAEEIVNPRLRLFDQPDAPPDSAGDKPGHDVPAEHGRRFAQIELVKVIGQCAV